MPPIPGLTGRLVVHPNGALAILLTFGPLSVILGMLGYTLPAVLVASIVETVCVSSLAEGRVYKMPSVYQGFASASLTLDYLVFASYAAYRGYAGALAVYTLLSLLSHASARTNGRVSARILTPSYLAAGAAANLEAVLGSAVATALSIIALGVGVGLAAATLIYREAAGFS